MPLTYPPPPASVSGGGTVVDVHQLLKSPSILARRMRTLAEQRYIADFLLKGRYEAVGGAILYEIPGGSITTNDDPEAVAPGGNYPITTADSGQVAVAKTTNWGRDVIVTDVAISRLRIAPVDRALTKLINRSVAFIDSAALGVIASAVTATFDTTGGGAPGAWTDGNKIVEAALRAKVMVEDLGQGYSPDVIVLTSTQWAKAVGRLSASGLLPREANNPVVTGAWPETLGLTWVYSPHTPATDPMLLDTTQLGGMADETIDSPGYSRGTAGVGVETKVIRDDDQERYKLRARRVTVPVVVEPGAGIRITNTGL